MDKLLQNIRYAARVLSRTPGFTLTVVLTLALAIGANSAVFSAIDAVLLKPLPFPDADRLVQLDETRDGNRLTNVGPLRLEDWNELNSTFEAMTGYYTEDVSETSGDLPERFRLANVAPRFLDVWGIAPEIGRNFTPAEHNEGAACVVLISHRYWQRRLGAVPDVLEQELQIGGDPCSIIGVLPASVRFTDRDVDLWRPTIYARWLSRGMLWYSAFGRLKPGVSVQQAHADLANVQAQLAEQYPGTDRGIGVDIVPLKESTVGAVRGSLWLLFGAVSVLLLIACMNIAALLLSRAAQRKQEISVRISLGASRGSVGVQILIETALLAFAGAVVGLLVAAGAATAFRALAPEFPRVDELVLDSRIFLYTLVSIVVVTLLSGLLPAILSSRKSLAKGSLSEAGRSQVSGRHSLQWLFVGVQVALSVTLLAGAGLLVRSFQELSRVDPGFEPSRILSFRISGSYGEDFASMIPRFELMLSELSSLPGVEAAATSSPVPGVLDDGSGFQFGTVEYEPVSMPADAETSIVAKSRVISPGYFETMQIPLVAGELCKRRSDGAAPEIMVNRAFATRYLPGLQAAGIHLTRTTSKAAYKIMGVVGDAREYGLNLRPVPTIYECQVAEAFPPLSFLVRTDGDPMAVARDVRSRIKEMEPLRAVYDIARLDDRIGGEYAQDRLRTFLLVLFAATAMSLACLGVYGTLNYIVSRRRREVALRVALGAVSGSIVLQFLLRALGVVGIACAAGLVLAFLFTRTLSSMLYGVSPYDPITMSIVVSSVLAVAALAALWPAIRASRVEPMDALRHE